MSTDQSLMILGKNIPRGKRTMLELEIAKLHTRTPITVPIIVERAQEDGPVLLLMGGIHGDEVNGVAIVRDMIRKKYNIPKRGTVICIPVFNVFGYLIQTREFPDGRDLNRVFPGSASGSLASQFAYALRKEIAPHVDYVIDFHTGGAQRENVAQIRCVFKETETVELAKVFGAPFIIHSNYIAKSVRETFNKMGKTVLLFEGGKTKDIDPDVVRCGVEGAINVMRHLGMQTGAPEHRLPSVMVEHSKWVRANHSGMFQATISNGSFVKKNKVLGMISDPYGSFERKVLAPFDGYVICINNSPVVNRGNALFHMSYEPEE